MQSKVQTDVNSSHLSYLAAQQLLQRKWHPSRVRMAQCTKRLVRCECYSLFTQAVAAAVLQTFDLDLGYSVLQMQL